MAITSLHLQHGGVEMAISLLANALCEKGFQVQILCTYNLGEPAYPLDPRVQVRYLTQDQPNREAFQQALHHKNPIGILREGLRAVGILRRKKRTMIQAISSISTGTILSTRNEHSVLLSRYGQPGVKKVAQLHHDHLFDPKLIEDFQKHYEHIDYLALLVPQLTQEVQEFMKGHNTHTQCITIGNFLKEDPCPTSPIQRENQVIAVGRLHPDKGFDRLLQIWSQVAPTHPEWTLRIIGEGPLRGALEQQCQDLGIQNSVQLPGALPHDQVMQEMSHSAIYAMTSVSEGFPFVLIEAMACALPIVAYDVRVGPGALIQNEHNGILVPDNQTELFAQQLSRLMDQTSLRTQMGQAGREKSKEYLQDHVLEQWLSIL